MIKIITKVCKGNSEGVGFIRIPISQRQPFNTDDNFRVTIFDEYGNHVFYGRIKDYRGLGIYVPKEIIRKSNLLQKSVNVSFEKINGFYTSLGSDGRLYIPKSVFENINLKNNEIVVISANIENKEIEKFCRMKRWVHKKGVIDFYCMFGSKFSYKRGIFRIKERLKKPDRLNEITEMVRDSDFGIYKDHAIVFHGHKVPITINPDINISELVYYLGHFFADGTKKGNSWGLCISTFEQAAVFLKAHKEIIPDANLDIEISFTGNEKKNLINVWHRKTGILAKKIRFYKTNVKNSGNRNKFGTLVVKEHRKLTQIFYNRLIDFICKKIETDNDRKLSIDFICGVLEGDGSPSAKKNGHIIISTNKDDALRLEKVLKVSGLDFKVCEEKTGKVYIRIGALGILKNLPVLKNKLFRYYPKRRKKFIERFTNIGANRFILGEQNHASSWVKAYLKDNKILDGNYRLTDYGKDIKKYLEAMIKEVKL